MKVAIFGRESLISNSHDVQLLINGLKRIADLELWCYAPLYKLFKESIGGYCKVSSYSNYTELPKETSFLLSLGGDGTFLESLTFVRDSNIPVAGINFGRLGFLTTAFAQQENRWIEALVEGRYKIVERNLLKFSSQKREIIPPDFYSVALNEITIQRSNPIMVEIEVTVNGERLPHYMADGILIASATGSTAYSLSIGGPIATPDSKVLIIAPIAPHNLNVRPIIVPEDAIIEVSYSTRSNEALLTLDNRSLALPSSAKFVISKADYHLRSISIDNNFMQALSEKLLWGEDKRNR